MGKGYAEANPLLEVEKWNLHPVRLRRGLTDKEFARLLDVAGESRIGYLLGVHTGLRRGELKALKNRHVQLNSQVPKLFLEGHFTKNGESAFLPLHRDLVAELTALKLDERDPEEPLLRGQMLPSMWFVKKHLKLAGIPFVEKGRRFDFHALRHMLATRLASRNTPVRVAMEIMRHSDSRLTMQHYTDAALDRLRRQYTACPRFLTKRMFIQRTHK